MKEKFHGDKADAIDRNMLRQLAIEAGDENIQLKDIIVDQQQQIDALKKEIEFKDELLKLTDSKYQELCNDYEIIKHNFQTQTEELKKYINDYKDIVKEMQLRKAKTNRIINKLEKSLLRQSKRVNRLGKEEQEDENE